MTSLNSDKILFDKYYKQLCYFAWQMVHDQDLAEDLAQDAFVAYFQRKDTVSHDETAIKSFLYSSVKFSVYNRHRKSLTERKFWQRSDFKESDDIDYEHQIIKAEFMAALAESIAKLPEGCRMVMNMSFVEGLSNDEIASQLALSVNTIKTQKQRGLNFLRKNLRADYFSILFAFLLTTIK